MSDKPTGLKSRVQIAIELCDGDEKRALALLAQNDEEDAKALEGFSTRLGFGADIVRLESGRGWGFLVFHGTSAERRAKIYGVMLALKMELTKEST